MAQVGMAQGPSSVRQPRSRAPGPPANGATARSWRTTEPPAAGIPPLPVFVCTTYNYAVRDASDYPRATREAGRQTRRALLNAAARLFAEHGVAGVSAAEIAREAGAFPSQVTYY